MNHKIKIAILLLVCGFLNSCDRDLESEGITTGLLRYPTVQLMGERAYTLVAGEGTFTDPGAKALLGEDDISGEIEVTGTVDAGTPGVYPINYSVSTENEIGQESTSSATRFVIVTSEDVSGVDLSGKYKGTGFASNPVTVTVTKLADGWYNITDVLSSSNNINVNFAYLGGDEILIPSQVTGFGVVNTTDADGEATLTPEGFTWTVFISCCGDFGPINFVKQ